MAAPEKRRWYRLRSGTVYFGTRRSGAEPCAAPDSGDTEAHPVEHDLGQMVTDVYAALAAGDRKTSDRIIRHIVHEGVSPTDVCLAFAEHGVETGESVPAVGADVPGVDLPADAPEVSDAEVDSSGPPADDQVDDAVEGQDAKGTPRKRGKS